MARRRRVTTEVSLFAFQDVMAAVIGILFFVVLLMALSITEAPRVQQTRARAGDVGELQRRAREVQVEIARLERRLLELERAKDAKTDERRRSAELFALSTKLTTLHEEIVNAQRARALSEVRLDELEQQLRTKAAEAQALEERLTALKDRARAGPRVSYILDGGPGTPEPWLVELTHERIRVATRDGAASVLTFAAPDPELRRRQFMSWIGRQDRKATYAVLLIKPSAVGSADELASALEEGGFRVGTDLLPDAWQVFE